MWLSVFLELQIYRKISRIKQKTKINYIDFFSFPLPPLPPSLSLLLSLFLSLFSNRDSINILLANFTQLFCM